MTLINLNNSSLYWPSSNDSSHADADSTKKPLDENTSSSSDSRQSDQKMQLKPRNRVNSPLLRVRRSPQFQIPTAQTYDLNTSASLQIFNQLQESIPVWTKQAYVGWNALCTPVVKFFSGEELLNSPQEDVKPSTDIIQFPPQYISATPLLPPGEEQWSKQTSDWELDNPFWVNYIPDMFESFCSDWGDYINRNLDRSTESAEIKCYLSYLGDVKHDLKEFQKNLNKLEKAMAYRQQTISKWVSWINQPNNCLPIQNKNTLHDSIIKWEEDTNKKLQDIHNVKEKIKIAITNLGEPAKNLQTRFQIRSIPDNTVRDAIKPESVSRSVIDNGKSNDIILTTFFNDEQETRIKQHLNDFFSNEDNKTPSIKTINKLYQSIEKLSHEAAFANISITSLYKEIVQTDEQMNQFVCQGIFNCDNILQFIMEVMHRHAGATDFNLQTVLDEIETKINTPQDNAMLFATIQESIKNDMIFYVMPTLSPDYIHKRITQNPNSTIKMDSVWVKHNTALTLLKFLGINPINISLNELSIFWGVCEAILTRSNLEGSTQKEAVHQWQSVIIQTLMMSATVAYVIDDNHASQPINIEDSVRMPEKALEKFCDLNIKTRQQEHSLSVLASMMNGYKTRTELGKTLLQKAGVDPDKWITYYKFLGASANAASRFCKSAFEALFHPASLQQIRKINDLPDINKEFDNQNKKIAEQFQKVDMLFLINGLSKADKEDINFIQNATSIAALKPSFIYNGPPKTFSDRLDDIKYYSMPANYAVFSATKNDGKKKYFALVYDNNNQYTLKTMTEEEYSYKSIVANANGQSLGGYSFDLFEERKITEPHCLDKLLQYITDKHKTKYNAALYNRGYEAPFIENAIDFLEKFIPFHGCFATQSITNTMYCEMDIIFIGLPLIGNTLKLGLNFFEDSIIASFSEAIAQETISKSIVSTLIETGANVPAYFSRSLNKELALRVLNESIDILDPGFKLSWNGMQFIKKISAEGLKSMGNYLSQALKETAKFFPQTEKNSLSKLSTTFSNPTVIENIQKLKQRGWKLGLRGGGSSTSKQQEATRVIEESVTEKLNQFKHIHENLHNLNTSVNFVSDLESIKTLDQATKGTIFTLSTTLQESENTFEKIISEIETKIEALNGQNLKKNQVITNISKLCNDDIKELQEKIEDIHDKLENIFDAQHVQEDYTDHEKILEFNKDVTSIQKLIEKIQENSKKAGVPNQINTIVNEHNKRKMSALAEAGPIQKKTKISEITSKKQVTSRISYFSMPEQFNEAKQQQGIKKYQYEMQGLQDAGGKLDTLLNEFKQFAEEERDTFEKLTNIVNGLKEKGNEIYQKLISNSPSVTQFKLNGEKARNLISNIESSLQDISNISNNRETNINSLKLTVDSLNNYINDFKNIELSLDRSSLSIENIQYYGERISNALEALKNNNIMNINIRFNELHDYLENINSYKIRNITQYLQSKEKNKILTTDKLEKISAELEEVALSSKKDLIDYTLYELSKKIDFTKKVLPIFHEVETFVIQGINDITRFEKIFKGNHEKIKDLTTTEGKLSSTQKTKVINIKKILNEAEQHIFESLDILKKAKYNESGEPNIDINLTPLNTHILRIGNNIDEIVNNLTKKPTRSFVQAEKSALELEKERKALTAFAQNVRVKSIDLNEGFRSPIQFPIDDNGPILYSTGNINDKTLLQSDMSILDDNTSVGGIPETKLVENQFKIDDANLRFWHIFPLNEDGNKYICLSSKAQTRIDAEGLVKYIKKKEAEATAVAETARKTPEPETQITILSGVHGAINGKHWHMQNGKLVISPNGADERIIKENNSISSRYSGVNTVDISKKTPDELYAIINDSKSKYIIATHCYGLNDTKLKEMFNFNTRLQNTYLEYTHYLLELDPNVLMNEFKKSRYFQTNTSEKKIYEIQNLVFTLRRKKSTVDLTQPEIDLLYNIFDSLSTADQESIVYLISNKHLESMIRKKYSGPALNKMLDMIHKFFEKKPSDDVIEKYLNGLRTMDSEK